MPIAPGTYWDLLDRDTPPVKRRAAHSKARTGCLTCKKRKVKCDETKPHCTRCIKSGHGCAGYEDQSAARRGADAPPSKAPKHDKSSSTARLLPRPKPSASTSISSTGIGDDELRLNLLRASLTPAYLDPRDALYFERFKYQVLADLGAWCGAEYWRHTILREILVDKTVQHAALAAAAMLMDIDQQQRERRDASIERSSQAVEAIATDTATSAEITYPETQPIVPLSHTSAHGKAALGHYTAAISGCRRTLAAEGVTATTARSSLTAAFFFAVFELVQGNVGEADRLLASGVQLLDHALAQTTAAGAPALVPDDALREIQLAFDRMRITWGLCPYFGGSGEDNANVASDARVRHFEMPSRDAPVRAKQVFWNAFSSDFGQFMVRMQQRRRRRCADDDEDDLSAIQAQRTRYLIQLQAWLPLLADLCAESAGSMVLATTKAYAQTAIVFLNCFLDASELAYDAYLPVFRDIVDTYRHLLPSSLSDYGSGSGAGQDQGHLRLTLDVDLFYIITFTVSKCRDRATRALALRVFAEMTRRQALWTNSGMLAALRALAALEDGGRDADGFVPATARYTYVHSEWDYQRRQMTAVFVPVLSTATQSDDVYAVRVPISF